MICSLEISAADQTWASHHKLMWQCCAEHVLAVNTAVPLSQGLHKRLQPTCAIVFNTFFFKEMNLISFCFPSFQIVIKN